MTKYPPNPILIVDDSREITQLVEDMLRISGLENTFVCHDSRKASEIISDMPLSVLVLDLKMPHVRGEDILKETTAKFPELPVIILTGNDDLNKAIGCMQTGAFDYVLKKDINRLSVSVGHALKFRELTDENFSLKEKILQIPVQNPEHFSHIVTKDKTMLSIFRYIELTAPTPHPILITGETGTGKELFANAVHAASKRTGRIISCNVAGFDDEVFSDTLFGHAKGAFTGASGIREGLIGQAEEGTLFLDEIGDLSIASQIKLLRFLQNNTYYPIGSDREKKADTRIITATNRNLWELQKQGKYRDDLIFRLNTHTFSIPPLRERKGDIPLLVNHFVERSVAETGKKKPEIPGSAIPLLESYSFPGNIRELESMICDAVSRSSGKLNIEIRSSQAAPVPMLNITSLYAHLKDIPTLKEAREALISEAMKRALGNQTVAARMLGITQPTLSAQIKKRKSETD
ncbi:MAG: sigma-54-dependent Fis family transcriptional regulator [Desulfobacterales bacterium]|nr:sigma-54-dependent Fis family transcriptional regulator [Desulfobacterales bacterium]